MLEGCKSMLPSNATIFFSWLGIYQNEPKASVSAFILVLTATTQQRHNLWV